MLEGAEKLPTIETGRLRLRWLTPADAPSLLSIFGDPAVCRYLLRPPLTDLSAADALQEEIARYFADRTLFQWGVADRESDLVVGTCTLAWPSAEHRRAELGFVLAPEMWGRGYMTEALPALIRFAFEDLALHRLEADADPRNQRSIKLLEQLGFQREGHQRERYNVNGELQDAVLFGLLRPDWARNAG